VRIRYLIPFSQKLIVPDHWEIPLQGGVCRLHEEDGVVQALEIVFDGQPTRLAPRIADGEGEGDVPTIQMQDANIAFVRVQLRDAMAFLQGQFNVGLDWDAVETFFEPESDAEDEDIHIKNFKMGKHTPPSALPFDLLARAIVCAERERGPTFEATLSTSARMAMSEKRYIDSFRYSFLLIESLYGNGKFRSADLKRALAGDADFRKAVEVGRRTVLDFPKLNPSDTLGLLEKGAVDEIIDHIVDKRGVYFHGNLKRRDAWRAERQDEADTLATLCAAIALHICFDAARSMFAPSVEQKFHEYSVRAGAQIVYMINYTYRMPGEEFSREGGLRVNTIGTKPTGASAVQLVKQFAAHFEEHFPLSSLERAVCVVDDTGERVFEMRFAGEPDSTSQLP